MKRASGASWWVLPGLGAAACAALVAWEASSFGALGGPTWASLVLALVLLLTTPLARARLSAWSPPPGQRPFWRQGATWRLLVVASAVAFLGVVFGKQRQAPSFLVAHFLGLALGVRLLLCAPARLQAGIERLRSPWLRRLDLLLFQVLLSALLLELGLHAVRAHQGLVTWGTQGANPMANKLRAPIFGFAPNALGYNDVEHPLQPPPAELRVAFVGDSFVVGCVPRPYTMATRLEQLLGGERPGSPRLRVLNFGVLATAPPEYSLILEEDALPFRPAAVIVGVYVGNDIKLGAPTITPLNKRWYALYQEVDRLRRRWRAQEDVDKGWFVDLTANTDLSRETWFTPGRIPAVVSRERYVDLIQGHLKVFKVPTDAEMELNYGATLAALDGMLELCRARGVAMAVEISPEQTQVSPRLWEEVQRALRLDPSGYDLRLPQQRITAWARERGVPCFDLTPVFAAAPDPDALYLPNDVHWSAPGNEVAAQELARQARPWLESLGLPPR